MEFEFDPYEAIEIYYYGLEDEAEFEFLSPIEVDSINVVYAEV